LVEDGEGFRLELSGLGTGNGASPLAGLRSRLDPARLLAQGVADPGEVPDPALAAAAQSGIWSNPAFLGIVDDLLLRAPCLCCYRTSRRAVAEEADQQIGLFLRYYAQHSHEGSNAFYRALGCLCRDATAAEAALVGRHPRGGAFENSPAPPPGLAAAQRAAHSACQLPGLAALAVPHPLAGEGGAGVLSAEGVALLFCSTPEARRLLRRLSRESARRGLSLATRALAGADGFVPRFLGRYYAVEFHAQPRGAAPAEAPAAAWAALAAATARVGEKSRASAGERRAADAREG
jgi:hypothetical protein